MGRLVRLLRQILEVANTVVVKRLKEVSAGKREFEQQMEVVGSIKHANVSELRAYYYSKDEKLLVYDYFTRGSVAAMLHGMLLSPSSAISLCVKLTLQFRSFFASKTTFNQYVG